MKLYVGNLPYTVDDAALNALLAPYGTVESARVVADRDSGRSKGYGFAEMSEGDALKAMAALNGSQYGGRTIHVNEARSKGPASGHGPGRGAGRES